MEQSVEHVLEEARCFLPRETFSKGAHISSEKQYQVIYRDSIDNTDQFWLEQTKKLEWFKTPTVACEYKWDSKNREIWHRWFEDGTINLSVNCLDRHLKERADSPAIIWQGDEDQECKTYSYQKLYEEVCRFANVLKGMGVKKGDRVCIYLPMIPELAISVLACARIGAIHSVVFAGFSAESLRHRINDSSCKILITANVGVRGGKSIPLKRICDQALEGCSSINGVVVVKNNDQACEMQSSRDHWYHKLRGGVSADCPAEKMQAEDPLFILYTSGSTGSPKGVVHTQAGYLLYAAITHRYIFDIHPGDVYWCTADIGWITGHSYVIYGPLANGTTTLMFEGVPTYPDPGRFWQIIQKHQVTKFYTAPTAIRALIAHGAQWPKKYDLSSLEVLGTVGEPINPEAWMWYYEVIGNRKLPIVDTWWQTETGGILLSPLPGCHAIKPGSASRPFFGIVPIIVREDGSECTVNEGGSLCIKRPWPGMMRTTWGDHDRFIDTYFTQYENLYFTGDGCRVDQDGDFWLMGRIDDVVNISGHRLGTAEIESALVSHPSVAEAAVVPIPHKIKGEALFAYVTPVESVQPNQDLNEELLLHVRNEIGAIAVPEELQFAKALPKTRSGKIMRRILRKIAEGDIEHLGDTTTLADPQVIEDLLAERL